MFPRVATYEDIDSILPMAENLWQLYGHKEPFIFSYAKEMAKLSIDQGLLCVLDGIEGFLAAVKGPTMGNPSVIMAAECGFWIKPKARCMAQDLVLFFEESAKNAGVNYLLMSHIEDYHPSLAEKFYLNLGFVKKESHYIKVL